MPRRRTPATEYERRLLRAQLLVQERLDERIDPAELAQAADFSVHHFHRIFRAQMGETVMHYVRRLRLERAARTITNSDARLLDVALEAGYESHEAFTRAFAERFGVLPSHFRARRSMTWEPPRPTGPSVAVRLESCSALRVAFMRHRGSYARVGETWQRMVAWAAPRGLLDAGPAMYGVCPDDPQVTDEPFLRFDACVVIGDELAQAEAEGEVGVTVIPAGTYAIGLHVGPYDRLDETYLDVIGRWFPKSGYDLAADAVVEHYLNDPSCTQADDLQTEVRVRIAD